MTQTFKPDIVNVGDAKRSLEASVEELNKKFTAAGGLPWSGV